MVTPSNSRSWRRIHRAVALSVLALAVTAVGLSSRTSGDVQVGSIAAGANGAVAVVETAPHAPAAVGLLPMNQQNESGSSKPDESLLPVKRWIDATSGFHSRIDVSVFHPNTILEQANRSLVAGSYMSMGNTLWGVTTETVETATQFNVVDSSAGGVMDKTAGNIGQNLLTNPSLLAGLFVVLAAALVWKMASARASGSTAMKELARGVLVIGVMGAMVNGSMNTTFDKKADTVTYGVGSPGWVVHLLNTSISSVSGSLTTGLLQSFDTPGTGMGRNDAYSCNQYVKALEQNYTLAAANSSEASTTLALNDMWKLTGLQAWIQSQFGNNEDGYSVYCRLLEERAGVSSIEQRLMMANACQVTNDGTTSAVNCLTNTQNAGQSLALAGSAVDDGGDTAVDVAMVGWAVCVDTTVPWGDGPWVVRDSWAGFNADQAQKTSDDCKLWWSAPSSNIQWWTDNSFLNAGQSAKDATSKVSPENADATGHLNFLWSMHGNSAAGAGSTGAPAVYAGSAVLNLLAFGMASGLIIISKLMAVMFMLLLFFMMLFSLWPGTTDDRLIGKFLRQFIGMTFISFGYSVILSMMVLVASLLVQVAASQFGAGSTITMVASGASPLVAWVAIMMLFKNVFKAPNPMSIRGGLAYAGMTGAIGGAAASAVSNMGNKAKSAASRATVGRIKTGISGVGSGAGKAGLGVAGGTGGSMRGAVPQTSVPKDSTMSEVLAAHRHHEQSQADKYTQDVDAANRAADAVVDRRTEGIPETASRLDMVAANFARQRELSRRGQDVEGSRMGRVLARRAVRIAEITEKPRANFSDLTWAAVHGTPADMAQAARNSVADLKTGTKNVAVKTAKGAAFAAQHPLKTTGKVATAAAITTVAVTPGGFPLALAAVAAKKTFGGTSRGASDTKLSAGDVSQMLEKYRAAKAAKDAGADAKPSPEPSSDE